MTQGSNISLQIKSGESLSYVIDKKLDADLGVDVKLGLSEWNSVFGLIKSEQVSTNKDQFGSKDTDIKNGKHYIVHEGTYEIKNNIWTQIVDIAKRKMGITSTQKTQEKAAVETENTANNVPTRESVTAILTKAGISTEGLDIDDILNKYQNITQYYADNNLTKDTRGLSAEDRIINYAKALQTHNTEVQFAQLYDNNTETSDLKIEIVGVKEAIESFDGETEASYNNAIKMQNDAFHQAAIEHIELSDTDNDGKISFEEYLAQSISDEENRLGRKLTKEEKDKMTTSAINRFSILNQDDESMYLNQNEIAAYIWATSKAIKEPEEKNQTAFDITYSEWTIANESMAMLDFDNLEQKEIDQITLFSQTLKNGYEGLKRDLP